MFKSERGSLSISLSRPPLLNYTALALISLSTTTLSASEATLDFSGSLTGKEFCYSCYEDNYKKFNEILTEFQKSKKPRKLRKIDDFYLTRVGILVHEECFDIFGERFDVEQAVSDAITTGFSCLVNGKQYADEKVLREKKDEGDFRTIRDYENGGSVFQKHSPRLVNLFTQQQSVPYAPVRVKLTDGSGIHLKLYSPCTDLARIPGFENLKIDTDCEFHPELELGRPKLLCSPDLLTIAAIKKNDGRDLTSINVNGRALGSLPNSVVPIYKKWKGKTKVYNGPMIIFLPESYKMHVGAFQSTLWHELFHNIGYEHDSKVDQDPYFCQVACFHGIHMKSQEYRSHSAQMCTTNDLPDDTAHAIANNIGNWLRQFLEDPGEKDSQ